jgi:hypothetical protein
MMGCARYYMKKRPCPCCLAGVDYLHPIYRRANNYPYLLEEGFTAIPNIGAMRSCTSEPGPWLNLTLPRPSRKRWRNSSRC